jgi:hypothetical protein
MVEEQVWEQQMYGEAIRAAMAEASWLSACAIFLSRNPGNSPYPHPVRRSRLLHHPKKRQETTMADDPKKTGLDRKLISLNEAHEVRSWTVRFHCTEAELREAVAKVGHSVEKVQEYLHR